jgi:hypothetical protein
MLNFSKLFVALSCLLRFLNLKEHFTSMNSSVLIICLELKEIGIVARLDDLLATKFNLIFPLEILNDFLNFFCLLIFFRIGRLDPLSVILLVKICLNDSLLNQKFTRLSQAHGDFHSKAGPLRV